MLAKPRLLVLLPGFLLDMSVLSSSVRGNVGQGNPTAHRVARLLPCGRNIHASQKVRRTPP
jgi:hypothetical protein